MKIFEDTFLFLQMSLVNYCYRMFIVFNYRQKIQTLQGILCSACKNIRHKSNVLKTFSSFLQGYNRMIFVEIQQKIFLAHNFLSEFTSKKQRFYSCHCVTILNTCHHSTTTFIIHRTKQQRNEQSLINNTAYNIVR